MTAGFGWCALQLQHSQKKDPTFPPSGAPSKFIPRKSREWTQISQSCTQVAVDRDAVAEFDTRVYVNLFSYLLGVHTFINLGTHHSGRHLPPSDR